MLAPGAKVGRFVIVELLGHGGMGDVYRASDARLGRDVAVKVVRERDGDAPRRTATDQLLREARSAAGFAHANAVAVYDVGETPDGVAYIAMELVEGASLRRLVGDATVPLADRRRWLADVARVLAAAHARGLIHRDVKPENVMVARDGTAKVLDFGLARQIDVDASLSTAARQYLSTLSTEGGLAGSVAGTPLYMAPEQMRGERIDRRADQFSWGVMAYELLAGELPWGRGDDPLPLLASLMSTDPRPLAERDAQIPAHVSRAVQRALAKQAAARFPTMADALAAFERAAAAPEDEPGADVDRGELGARPMAPASSAQLATTARGGLGARPTAPASSAQLATTARGERPRRRTVLRAAAVVGVIGMIAAVAAVVRHGAGEPAPGTAAPPPPSPRCASHAACNAAGRPPARCWPDVGCVALGGDGCEVLAEPADLLDDRTVFFGAVVPLGKDRQALSDLQAMELARRDFASIMRGFRAGDAYGRVHPLALVACDETLGAARAVRHLVDDVRAPAIMGFSSGAELMAQVGATLGPRGVLVVAPFTTSPLLRSLPRVPGAPRLVFRTTYDSAQTARALGAAIPAVLEPALVATPGAVDRGHPLRVALVRQSATRLSAFAGAFFGALRFNGKSALDNGPSYREIAYDEADPASPTAGYAAVRAQLLAFAPHVVVYVGGERLPAEVIVPTERDWKIAAFRPRWLSIGALVPDVLRFVDRDPARRRRFFGISEATNAPANARFVLHYNEVFPDPIARAGGPNSSYDAFYLLAYATYALADDTAVTGRALAGAIARLVPPGPRIEVGAAAIFDAFSALRRGDRIDLDGAAGSLDFDLETGDAPVDQVVLCIGVDDAGRATHSVESGVVYDAHTGQLRGQPRCP